MSHTSRSYQLAAGQMLVILGSEEPVFGKGYLDAQIFVALKRKQMIDNRKIARRLAIAMRPHALIDRREVVQHLVRPVDLFFQKSQQRGRAIFRHPKRGYAIERCPEARPQSQAAR